jgi:hypothetical protein
MLLPLGNDTPPAIQDGWLQDADFATDTTGFLKHLTDGWRQ